MAIDITDICGIRLITFFEDEVDAVGAVIKREFTIDQRNSTDKRSLLDPDRFGYLSLHFVASLSSERLQLTEYRRFGGIKLEIQIRSILQHAWAEIEHDLGYKAKHDLPVLIERRFSRLAGLLEIVDSEFVLIRKELNQYEHDAIDKVVQDPNSIGIDKASLEAFIKSSSEVKSLSKEIAGIYEAPLLPGGEELGYLAERLMFCNLSSIADVQTALKRLGRITLFIEREIASSYGLYRTLQGIYEARSLFTLCLALLAEKGAEAAVREFLEKFGIDLAWNSTLDNDVAYVMKAYIRGTQSNLHNQ